MNILSIFVFSLFSYQSDGPELGKYFGFKNLEVIKIGDQAGPMYTGDINGDGLIDVIVINNRKSRIDVLLQKFGADPQEEPEITRPNEIPEHWRFEHKNIMVAHHVSALALHDFNSDGLTDLVYAGNPNNIVFLLQENDGTFKKERTHRLRNLNANRDAFTIKNIVGDDLPELITIVDGDIAYFTIDEVSLGNPFELSSEDRILVFEIADYDGDGLEDVIGVVPDNSQPIRLWLTRLTDGKLEIGPQLRFEMPTIREFASVQLPNQAASLLAIIERTSKRLVIYSLTREEIDSKGDREASIEIYPFLGKGAREQTVVDVNNDGLLDLVATNPEDNTIVIYAQQQGKGLSAGVASPTLSGVDAISIADIDQNKVSELYVLSEDEGVVGRTLLNQLYLTFPEPIPFTSGNTPVSISSINTNGDTKIVVVSKEKRSYVIDLLNSDGSFESIDLGSLSRGPDEIIGFDADQDGATDMLLLTRDKPMKMLHSTPDGFEVLDGEEMGQYGLVRAASVDNTTLMDIDGDGIQELLIAEDNYVRAVRYELDTSKNVSPGWQVVQQINIQDGESDLISIASSHGVIYVADKENERIIRLVPDQDGVWGESDSLFVHGYKLGPMYIGDFTSDGVEDILAIGAAGFAVIQVSGNRIALNETASWRSEHDHRVQHEIAIGDVNSDGFTDLITLDAGEQMLEIHTFSELSKLIYATAFKIFESKIFSGGASREWEPSQVIITDLTNDGHADILLLSHDRLLLYPQ